jgi:lysosomal acid phosphatase
MNIYNLIKLLILEYLFILSENKVVFVFEYFRHGARSPSDLFENDVDLFQEKWNGLQELTNVGLRQHYLLGNHIRNKYPDLINYEKYNPKELEVFSSMTNRTIMSARAQTYGLFDTVKSAKINEKQKNTSIPYYLLNEIDQYNINSSVYPDFYPEEIPIHIIDYKEKLFQLEKNDVCPAIKKIRKENQKKKEITEFVQKFNDTFGKDLLNIYNITDNKDFFMDIENVNDLCIGIIIAKFDDRKLDFLKDKIDLEALHQMSKEYFNLKVTLVYAQDEKGLLGIIGSSILIRKILSYMERVRDDKKKNLNDYPKLLLLSSHDTAISSLEDLLLNLFNIEVLPPSYSSSYIFELNEENNEYSVNIVFNNEVLKNIKYNDFKNKIEKDSWTYEQTGKYCGFIKEKTSSFRKSKKKNNNKWLAIIIIFSLLNAVMIVIIMFMLIKFKKPKYIEPSIKLEN